MKTRILFLLKFLLLFSIVASTAFFSDNLVTTYGSTNSKMNHLLYNYADATNLPFQTFYLNDATSSSVENIADKISGMLYQPKAQEVFNNV